MDRSDDERKKKTRSTEVRGAGWNDSVSLRRPIKSTQIQRKPEKRLGGNNGDTPHAYFNRKLGTRLFAASATRLVQALSRTFI